MREKLSARRDDHTPLYLQFAHNLREHIHQGGVDPGHALPSERDLSQLTGMSRVTVRKGIQKLIDEGLLLRRQGSGTYVTERIVSDGSTLSGFSDDARTRGEDARSVWIIRAYAAPTDEEAEKLGISVNTEVVRLGRVRLSDGEPLAIEHAVVPRDFLPPIEEIGESLYEALEKRGNRPMHGTQRLHAALATPTEAGILSVQQNSEILRLERLTCRGDGTPVEFTRSAYRGDRYAFVTDLALS